jgi:thiamine phosphate phosphatase / amino-HMP aminohydrolase
MDSSGVGTGKLSKSYEEGIRTGPDKLREMKQVLGNSQSITVYIGDSNTDLPCLLHANIGIIIGSGESLIETCNRVGIAVEQEFSFNDTIQTWRKGILTLYHFNDWYGIIESGLLE